MAMTTNLRANGTPILGRSHDGTTHARMDGAARFKELFNKDLDDSFARMWAYYSDVAVERALLNVKHGWHRDHQDAPLRDLYKVISSVLRRYGKDCQVPRG